MCQFADVLQISSQLHFKPLGSNLTRATAESLKDSFYPWYLLCCNNAEKKSPFATNDFKSYPLYFHSEAVAVALPVTLPERYNIKDESKI